VELAERVTYPKKRMIISAYLTGVYRLMFAPLFAGQVRTRHTGAEVAG